MPQTVTPLIWMQFSLRNALLFVTACGVLLWGVLRYQTPVLRKTSRSLDLAVLGRGHFCFFDPEAGEIRYTRRGNFFIDANGALEVGEISQDRRLEPVITIPGHGREITVSPEGRVMVRDANSDLLMSVGVIELATFSNVDALREVSPEVFVPTAESGIAHTNVPGAGGMGFIQQGYLESSGGVDVPTWAPTAVIFAILGFLVWELRALRRRLDQLTQSGVRSDE